MAFLPLASSSCPRCPPSWNHGWEPSDASFSPWQPRLHGRADPPLATCCLLPKQQHGAEG